MPNQVQRRQRRPQKPPVLLCKLADGARVRLRLRARVVPREVQEIPARVKH